MLASLAGSRVRDDEGGKRGSGGKRGTVKREVNEYFESLTKRRRVEECEAVGDNSSSSDNESDYTRDSGQQYAHEASVSDFG